MDKNAIKKYAVWARRELISRVTQKALQYGITEKELQPADASSVNGVVLSAKEKKQRQALIAKISAEGFEQVMEEVAYTWFNRFSALRFMEVNGYLPTHVRVFTDEENNFKPQILAEAINLEIEGLDMEKVYALKDANDNDALFKYLIITQCNALSAILPGMFQKIDDYTELLFPDNLLREGSAIEQMIAMIPEEDWQDAVQIIGWLYQYYNIEPKADIDAKVKKGVKVSKREIPAKTQIFTPDWVVRYMVENSLGKLWIDGHANDDIKLKWRYFLDEAPQEQSVEERLGKIHKECEAIKPEDIKCVDPCSGSGHILAYLFDVLMQVYNSYGYTFREAVESIITNNLYGLDIDERAVQLSYFSVMMKARQYDRRFFSKRDNDGNLAIPQPMIYAIRESNSLDKSYLDNLDFVSKQAENAFHELLQRMKNAKEYGSLISTTNIDFNLIYESLTHIMAEMNIYSIYVEDKIIPFVKAAECLSRNYDVVCTNPPYLGGGAMSEQLAEFAKDNFPESKNDMFALFIERGNQLAKSGMFNCMVTMQSWMFLSSYEKLRNKILSSETITNLLHMDNQVMGIAFGTAVTILRNCYIGGYKGTYNYIYNSDINGDIPIEFPVSANRFAQVSAEFYRDIPGSPIAYWISKTTRDSFLLKDTIGTVAPPKQGLATADNNRFLRLWHEVEVGRIGYGIGSCDEALVSGKKWFPYNKGGAFRRWYGNRDYVVNWENDGYEIKNFKDDKGKVRSRPQNLKYYFSPAITWSDVTSGSFSGRYVEQGFMFDIKGSSGFPKVEELPYVLGLLNSKVAQAFIKILNPTMTTQVGDMTRIPVKISYTYFDEITELVNQCIELSKEDWDSFETSWGFEKHPLVGKCHLISEAYSQWDARCNYRFETIMNNEEIINRRFIEIYGLDNELNCTVDEANITLHRADKVESVKSLISYAVGCMFGRYSLERNGIVYASQEQEISFNASFPVDKDNIIPISVDEYFTDDIASRFFTFIEVVFGKETLEENLDFIATNLGGKGSSRTAIRNYFLNNFYSDHCNTYSIIGSGKRPIYWLFDSGECPSGQKKGGFKALIYMHRYQPDTIARIRTDYIHEQQGRYRTAIADLEKRMEGVSTSDRVKLSKQLATLQAQATELHDYEEKIHHLADQYISIDLDDGVKVNYAKFQDVLAKIK